MKRFIGRITGLALAAALTITAIGGQLPASKAEAAGSGKIQAQFFVSPQGDDKNEGTYDKPFASLKAARDAVRKINGSMSGDIYVFVEEGGYYMEETLTLDQRDSGTNGYKVIYRNLDKTGSAELIGGRKVDTPWEMVDGSGDPAVDPDADLPASAQGKVYKTHVGEDLSFYTLYVNDRRATLARTQNRQNENGFSSALTPYMRSAGGGVGDLIYKSGDIGADSINGLVNAQARGDLNASVYMWDGGYWDWMTDTIPVSAIDTASNKLTYKTVSGHPEMYRPKYATRNNARYFIQGNLGFLDAPGEYYFNEVTGDLYYYPEGDIEACEFVIPTMQEIIRLEGASRDSMVENIEIRGLTLKDADTTEWYTYGWNWGDAGDGLGFYPAEADGSTQPSYCEQTERAEFQYGNITMVNTKNISINRVHIKNSGMFGINLYLANQGATIQDCLIHYTGHGGIQLDGGYPGVGGDAGGDGYSRDNVIKNCLIHDIGELVGQASGITISQSGYNTVSNVEVYNSPRRGVFFTAGNSRNKAGADAGYVQMRDLYTHHNTLEYTYLHDCQQDGGDDGAFFACYLYNKNWYGSAEYKPNYVNQLVIDRVAANPSMTDIAPNGINLDMGCSGMELRNVKVVNPQHFNMEVETITNNGDQILFENVNVDFGTHTNLADSFDDSKMEYDKIGLTMDFPEEYSQSVKGSERPEDIYFAEDFEGGLDISKWSYKDGTPETTTTWASEGAFGGRMALAINSDKEKPVLYREFASPLNKVVTMKLFDRAGFNLCSYTSGISINDRITTYGRVDDGTTEVAMGIDQAAGGGSDGVYVLKVGDTKIPTDIGRFYGWHELKWDYSSGTDVKLYFDGKLVKTLTAADGVSTSFGYVAMGSENGSGITYFDELYIYGGQPAAQEPGTVPLPEVPEYDNTHDNVEQLNLDFEDGQLPSFYFTTTDTDRLAQELVSEGANTVLKHFSGDGHAFYQTNADWKNYLVKFKWKFGGWGNKTVLGGAYDNFTIYVMTTSDGASNHDNNPASYQVVYRKNQSGNGDFAAGTPYFEICKHTYSSDSSLGKVAVPEGFNVEEWHEFQIQTFDGKVGFSLDGQTMLSVNDGQYTSGGIGFGGINCTSYIDDIQIITNPTNVAYESNLGLDNINLNGEFNPNHYNYYVTVDDPTQPVTLTLPEVNDPTVTVKAELNGQEIANSADSTKQAKAAVVSGMSPGLTEEVPQEEAPKEEALKEEAPQEEAPKEEAPQEEAPQEADAAAETAEAMEEAEDEESPKEVILDGEKRNAAVLGDADQDQAGTDANGQNQADINEGGQDQADVDGNGQNQADADQNGQDQETSQEDGQDQTDVKEDTKDQETEDQNQADTEEGFKEQESEISRAPQMGTDQKAINAVMALADTRSTPIVLDLKRGVNELVLTESALAGKKEYRILINKLVGISSIGQIPAVATERGVAPVLPETVKVDFTDGGSEDVAIIWRMVSPMLYRQNGTFTVYGTLDGFADGSVSVDVTVNGLEGTTGSSSTSFGTLPVVTTQVGKAPVLSSTITVYRSDGQQSAALSFAELSPELYAKPGVVFAVGSVEGYEKIVLQEVHVTEADLASLADLVKRAEEIAGKKGEYTDTGWQEFEEALAQAKAVLETTDPDSADVQAAIERLQKAMDALRRKADKSQLKQAVEWAESIDTSGYTRESVEAFQKALEQAKALLEDADLSEDDQARIDAAVQALKDAIQNLKKTDSSNNNDNGNHNGNSGQNTGGTQSGKPKTGDTTSVATWILIGAAAALLFAATAASGYRKKRKGV